MFSKTTFGKIYKPFALLLLISGHQSITLCASMWDYVFGSCAVAGVAGWIINYRRFLAHKMRFKDAELVLDVYEQAKVVHKKYQHYINANDFGDLQARLSAIDLELSKHLVEFDGKLAVLLYNNDWIKVLQRTYGTLETGVALHLEELMKSKKKLDAKASAWKADPKKELMVPQMDIVQRDLARIIPALELVQDELPYGLCLAFEDSFGLLKEEHALALQLNDDKEIKYRLEAHVRKFASVGEQYPYCVYYEELQKTHARLEWVISKLKGLTAKPHQEALISTLKSRLIDLSALLTYIQNSHEFVLEQRNAEAERRAKEAEQKLKAAHDKINTLETTVAAHQQPAPQTQEINNASAPTREEIKHKPAQKNSDVQPKPSAPALDE